MKPAIRLPSYPIKKIPLLFLSAFLHAAKQFWLVITYPFSFIASQLSGYYEPFALYFDSIRSTGSMYQVMCLGAMSWLFGLVPFFLMRHWAVFFDVIAGGSASMVLSITMVIFWQALFYTFCEKPLDWAIQYLSARQSEVVRDHLLTKLPQKIDNITSPSNANQRFIQANTFFEKSNRIVKNFLQSITQVVGNFLYLKRYGYFSLGLRVFGLILVSDVFIFICTTAKDNWSLAAKDEAYIMQKNALSSHSNDLLKFKHFFLGQRAVKSGHIYALRQENEKAYKESARSHLWTDSLISLFTVMCSKILEPCVVIFFMLRRSLVLPLNISQNINGHDAGVFKQVLMCFSQIWRNGSICKNNAGDFSKLKSGYENAKPLYNELDYNPNDIRVRVTPTQSFSLLSTNIWLTILGLYACRQVVHYLVQHELSTVVLNLPALSNPLVFIAINLVFVLGLYHSKTTLSSILKNSLMVCTLSAAFALTTLFIVTQIFPSFYPLAVYQNLALSIYVVGQCFWSYKIITYEKDLSSRYKIRSKSTKFIDDKSSVLLNTVEEPIKPHYNSNNLVDKESITDGSTRHLIDNKHDMSIWDGNRLTPSRSNRDFSQSDIDSSDPILADSIERTDERYSGIQSRDLTQGNAVSSQVGQVGNLLIDHANSFTMPNQITHEHAYEPSSPILVAEQLHSVYNLESPISPNLFQTNANMAPVITPNIAEGYTQSEISYPVFCLTPDKSQSHFSNQSYRLEYTDCDEIRLENLALFENDTTYPTCALPTNKTITLKGMSLLSGNESTGKTALIMRALSSHQSEMNHSKIKGQVYLPGDLHMIFDENNNPMQDLSRFEQDFVFFIDGEPISGLTPLKKVFYSLTITEPDNMNAKDRGLWFLWLDIKKDILAFLSHEALAFDKSWITELDKKEMISPMSGGSKAKLMSAILYAILNIPNLQSGRKVTLAVDKGFDGIAENVLPHIFEMYSQRVQKTPSSHFIATLITQNISTNSNGNQDRSIIDLANYFTTHCHFTKR